MTQKNVTTLIFTLVSVSFSLTVHCRLRQDAEKVLLQDSSVLLCCTWVYTFLHVALLLSATDSEAYTPQHSLQHTLETSTILHNGTYTSQPVLVLSTHLRDCCTQRKCHLLTNWLRDCTHGELVDQLVWPNILGWKTEDGCFVPHYLVTPNIKELDNFSKKPRKSKANPVEKRKWSTA